MSPRAQEGEQRWVRSQLAMVHAFSFFNSVALMEANQKESHLRSLGAARWSWEGCSACEPGSGQALGSGCAGGAAAAAQNGRRFPGSFGATPPPSGKTAAGLGGGICDGAAGKHPLSFSPPAEAAKGAPAFAKLAGQLPRALVRAGPAEPFGA